MIKVYNLFKGTNQITKVSLERKKHFYYMLKFYLTSNISILKVFDLIYEDLKLKNILELKKMIKNGNSLVDSLNKMNFCDEFIFACLNVGEETGNYPLAIDKIVTYLDNRLNTKKYFMQLFSYPIFLFLFANLVFLFLIFFIVPSLHNTIQVLGVDVPFTIDFLYNVGFYIKKYSLEVFVISLCIIFLIGKQNLLRIYERTKNKILHIQFVQRVYNILILKNIFWQLNVLIKYKVDLISSIKIISKTLNSNLYKKVLDEIVLDLKNGKSLYNSIYKNKELFPKVVIEYLKVGEETSNFEENISKIVEFFEMRMNDMLAYLKQLAQPIIIIFVSLFVFMILLFILPMIDAVTSIGGV